jgi:16S rRNA (uracil1498-N3)-methyltransferase
VSTIRIYQPVPLHSDALLFLDEQASHHLLRVLRVKPEESLILFNGQGGEYEAVVTELQKKKVQVKIGRFLPQNKESFLSIDLAQGIVRGEKMDFILQKAVELGVKRIIPLLTERSKIKLDEHSKIKRLEHWKAVVVSACEQCGRNYLPEILPPLSLKQWLQEKTADLCFVLSPHLPNDSALSVKKQASIALLIGPEGGLSEKEMALSQQAGFLALNLGPRILRTETASIAAIAILQQHYGDFGLTLPLITVK